MIYLGRSSQLVNTPRSKSARSSKGKRRGPPQTEVLGEKQTELIERRSSSKHGVQIGLVDDLDTELYETGRNRSARDLKDEKERRGGLTHAFTTPS